MAIGEPRTAAASPSLIETVVSPFHCLYQDALEFHKQGHLRLARSVAEASRLARGALVLYLAAAESLVHQAAVELARPELSKLAADPSRPLPPADAWKLLPAIVGGACPADLDAAPWPQLAELFALRECWAYPGPASMRRAYYRSTDGGATFEPIQAHQVAAALGGHIAGLHLPLTGLPRDPYALRPHHVDTARGVLDAAVEALDRRLGGALTAGGRHRKEPTRGVDSPK